MTILTENLYEELGHEGGPFGLEHRQFRDLADPDPEMSHNGFWWNKFGQYIGMGDLSIGDLARIRNEITEDEIFIVTPEDCIGEPSLDEFDFILKYCQFIIVKGHIFTVDKTYSTLKGDGIELSPSTERMERADVETFIRKYH
jgi:hypothetical protein